MLAHELRNPLAPIRNASEVIRLSLDGEPADKAANIAVTIIERQVAHMSRLVEDLLDLSRVSRGVINLRTDTVNLSALVREAMASAHSQFASKGQSASLRAPDGPILMNGDETRLVQAFGNLLHNASKFTGHGGDIRVTIEQDGGTDSKPHALVTIKDNGIGIAPEQLPRIFEMFQQVDPRFERTVSGLGIGLTLVRTLVGLHSGTVEARSAGIGMGTEMFVRLPMLHVRK
jgi:signal transduction histidine kinase